MELCRLAVLVFKHLMVVSKIMNWIRAHVRTLIRWQKHRQTMSKPQIIYFAYIWCFIVGTYFPTKENQQKYILFVIILHGSRRIHTFGFSELFYWRTVRLPGLHARTHAHNREKDVAWMNELVILTFTTTSKLYVIIIAIILHTHIHTMMNLNV